MTARTCYTQLQNLTRDLERTTLPKLPPALGFEGDVEYMKQVEIWKNWIQWEKDDNLVLKEEDLKAYRNRILFVYKQALMALQFWPEMWYDAAEFSFSCGMDKEGLDLLTQGIAANPESCLLAFNLADRIELTTTNDDTSDPGAKLRMQKVREPYNKVLESLYELINKARAREMQEIKKVEMGIAGDNFDTTIGGRPDDEEDYDNTESEAKKAEMQAQIDAIKSVAAVQITVLQKTLSFAWVALMRACRRIQGKGMQGERAGGFRTILTEARKKGRITSDVYIQSALIEYHCYKDNTATKIFERGIKLFPDDEIFALEYIKHLIAINDVTSKFPWTSGDQASLTWYQMHEQSLKPQLGDSPAALPQLPRRNHYLCTSTNMNHTLVSCLKLPGWSSECETCTQTISVSSSSRRDLSPPTLTLPVSDPSFLCSK